MQNAFLDLIEISGIAECFPSCSKMFKQLQIQEIVDIPPQKPDIEQVLSVHIDVHICKTTIIKTPKCVSCEGQILTGFKLLVEGRLHQKIEYVADEPSQSVHSAHFEIPFGTHIILSENACCDINLHVTGYIEDIYIKQISKRKIFKNILVLINAIQTNCN